MYLTASPLFAPLRPGQNGLGSLYASVFKQLGLSVFMPLFIGQVVRYIIPKPVDWAVRRLYLGKAATFCLVLIIWTTFSTCFATGAFVDTPPQSIIMLVFLNIGLALLMILISVVVARRVKYIHFSKQDTVALVYITVGKTPAIGIPLITAMYSATAGFDQQTRALLQIPMILYQIEQIFISQFSIPVFKRWIEKDQLATTTTTTAELDDNKSRTPTQLDSRMIEPV